MKQLTFIIALFAALCAQAQNVTRDTLYTVNVDGRFLEVQRFDYEDGSYNERSRVIGDTTALIDYMELRYYKTAQTYDRLASQLRFAPRDFNRMVQEDAKALAEFGRSPLIELQQQYDSTFMLDSYELDAKPISARRTAAGKLVFTIDGVNNVIDLFGDAMRIRNYPTTGKATVLYRITPNVWQDAGAEVVLRRTSISARKPAE